MATEIISVGFKAALAMLRFAPHVAKSLWNYWKRPNLKLSVRNSHIEFTDNDSKRYLPTFPSIRISNVGSKDVTFDIGQFSVNGESLTYIMQQNAYFARTHEQNNPANKLVTKNELLTTFRKNWASSKFLKLPAHEYIDIPLYPQEMSDSMYFKVLANAKIFFPKSKIVVVVTANSRESHYAVNRMMLLRIVLNCLVHAHDERFKSVPAPNAAV